MQEFAGEEAPQQASSTGAELPPISYARPVAGAAPRAGAVAGSAAAHGGKPSAHIPYHGVQQLMRLERETLPQAGGGVPVTGYYSSGEVMQALGLLEQSMAQLEREAVDSIGHATYLQQKIGELTGEEGRALSQTDSEAVSYVGGLVSSILQDQLVPAHAKPWFSRLEIPLLKAGMLDQSLLEDEHHPARQLLNRLERIGDLLQGDDSDSARAASVRIEELISAIRENVEHDPNVFADAINEVERIEEESGERRISRS
jgi:hypothetical protein